MSDSKEKQAATKTSSSTKTTPVGSTTVTASISQPIADDSKVLNKASSSSMGAGTKKKKTRSCRSCTINSKSTSRSKFRKQSYGFSGVSGIGVMSRSSMGNVEFKRPPLVFLPSYRLDPFIPFNMAVTQKVTEGVIDDMFLDHKYNIQESPALAMRIAQEVMRQVKALNFSRYRIFAVVTIGQKRAQSYYNAIAFLWDPLRDAYVNAHAEVMTAFVQVTVFAIYLD